MKITNYLLLLMLVAFIAACNQPGNDKLHSDAAASVPADSKSRNERLIELTKNYYIQTYRGEKEFEITSTDSIIELYFPDENDSLGLSLGMDLYINIPVEKKLSSGEKIIFGDLNKDGIEDAIVVTLYSLTSGHANTYNELVTFLGTKEGKYNFNSVTSERELSCPEGIPVNFFNPEKIEDGIIEGERICYADGDATCCPSIKTKGRAVLKGSKLVRFN